MATITMTKSAVDVTETSPAVHPSPWYNRINKFKTFWLLVVPIIGLAATAYIPLVPKTALFAVVYYFITGLGITAGYHRLWAHTSYTASYPIKVWLAATAAGACEESILTWSSDHRAHHRYTDTTKDPYSVRKGLLYSHIGWLLIQQDPSTLGRADISDLIADPVVLFQHNHYIPIALTVAFIIPTLLGGLCWNDYWGGFLYAGILRTFVVQQCTFCVNSLAHWLGSPTFDNRLSPRDHMLTALITMGEGYHNFHHEFPSDYRNALRWHQYDPTKWLIASWQWCGLAWGLKRFARNEIEKGRLQQKRRELERELNGVECKMEGLEWGRPLEDLPVMEWNDFRDAAAREALIVIAGVVYDVDGFVGRHPGGEAMIRSGVGKDATAMFNGGVYNHSNAAHNVLAMMRVGVIRGGCEVEAWKREKNESEERDRICD